MEESADSVPEDHEGRLAPLGVVVRCVLLVGAFLVTAGLVRDQLPWPSSGGLAAKFDDYFAHADDYDVLFLGSSRIARGVMPGLVDEELAAAGYRLRAYNLGVDAMTAFESDRALRHVVARRPANLRYVVIELASWTPLRSDHRRFEGERSIAWHDTRQTRRAARATWEGPGSVAARLGECMSQWSLWFTRLGNVGRGATLVSDAHAAEPPVSADELRTQHGFQSFDHDDPRVAKTGRAWRENKGDSFRARVERLAAFDHDAVGLTGYDVAALEEQVRLVEDAGYVPVLLAPPYIKPKPFVHVLAGRDDLPAVLNFHSPTRHPRLYNVEYRFDDAHLNDAGAALFSRLVGRQLAHWLSTGEAPP